MAWASVAASAGEVTEVVGAVEVVRQGPAPLAKTVETQWETSPRSTICEEKKNRSAPVIEL